jgi:hypothetical protein
MTYRLLFDENLSPELVELAIAAGYVNSTCVRDRGLRAVKDWELMPPRPPRTTPAHLRSLNSSSANGSRANGCSRPTEEFDSHQRQHARNLTLVGGWLPTERRALVHREIQASAFGRYWNTTADRVVEFWALDGHWTGGTSDTRA